MLHPNDLRPIVLNAAPSMSSFVAIFFWKTSDLFTQIYKSYEKQIKNTGQQTKIEKLVYTLISFKVNMAIIGVKIQHDYE
jgi:hypothetical protein